MLRSTLKTWRQSLMRCVYSQFSLLEPFHYCMRFEDIIYLHVLSSYLSFLSYQILQTSLFLFFNACNNSYIICFSLFHKSQQMTWSGILESYYMQIANGIKQVHGVIQMLRVLQRYSLKLCLVFFFFYVKMLKITISKHALWNHTIFSQQAFPVCLKWSYILNYVGNI